MSSIHVVLVRSESAANVGAAARAVANLGAEDLILLDPQCELGSAAKATAAGAQGILQAAKRYASWNQFFANEGEGVRLGLTRRAGRERKVFPLSEKLTEVLDHRPSHLYLIFGPEADGLSREDLAYVNFAVHLPVFGEFGSFNLAQAVLLALFIVRQQIPPELQPLQLKDRPAEPVSPFYFPDTLIKEWLSAMGFNVQARRASAYLTLRKLFLQSLPTRHEVQVLEAILQQNIRKLKASVGFSPEQIADNRSDIPGEDI